jgi:class 3 adenylate cyclase
VNHAARLCADAAPGQIVVDDAVREAAGVRDVERRSDTMLKGFGTTATYALRR